MVKTTAVQDKMLKLLKKRWRERGSQPNLNEVAGELGMQYMSLRQHLEALNKKGYLTFTSQGRGKPPVIRLAEKGPVRLEPHEGVPLLGDIAAGGLHEAVEHCEGFLSLPGRGERFALRVKGDSMSERIEDGDVVILRRCPFTSGDICAVRHEDETTLKYVDVGNDGRATLRPHNPLYSLIEVKLEEIYVAGVYDALLRGAVVHELFEEAA